MLNNIKEILRIKSRAGSGEGAAPFVEDGARSSGSFRHGRAGFVQSDVDARARQRDGRHPHWRTTHDNREADDAAGGVPDGRDGEEPMAYRAQEARQPNDGPWGKAGIGTVGRLQGFDDRVEDEDLFFSPSSHASRDPFLNDNTSIPASSTDPENGHTDADDGSRQFRSPFGHAEVFDPDNDLMARARSKGHDRSRARSRERPGWRSTTATTVSGRPSEETEHGAEMQADGPPAPTSTPSNGAKRHDLQPAGARLTRGDSETTPLAATGDGISGTHMGRASSFKGALSFDGDARGNQDPTLQIVRTSSLPTSARASSSYGRRRNLLRQMSAQAGTSPSASADGLSDQERRILRAIAIADTAIKEKDPVAAQELAESVRAQVASFGAAVANARNNISQARRMSAAVPDMANMLLEDLDSSTLKKSPSKTNETNASTAKNGRENTRRERTRTDDDAPAPSDKDATAALSRGADLKQDRLLELAWDIEAATAEKRWADAASLVEHALADEDTLRVRKSGPTYTGKARQNDDGTATTHASILAEESFEAAMSKLAAELEALCYGAPVAEVRRIGRLLVRMGLPETAQHAILLCREARLEVELRAARRRYNAGDDARRWITVVGSRSMATLCECYALLNEVVGLSAATAATFLSWSVARIEAVHRDHLVRHLDPSSISAAELAGRVLALRDSTLQVPFGSMFVEIGVVLDSRISALVRYSVFDSLALLRDSLGDRADAAGRRPFQEWQGVPLSSGVQVCDEINTFTRDVGLKVLGIDGSVDALVSSVLITVAARYVAGLLHVTDEALTSGLYASEEPSITRVVLLTLECIVQALDANAARDYVLLGNSSIRHMAKAIQEVREVNMRQADSIVRLGRTCRPERPPEHISTPPFLPAHNVQGCRDNLKSWKGRSRMRTISTDETQRPSSLPDDAPRVWVDLDDEADMEIAQRLLAHGQGSIGAAQ